MATDKIDTVTLDIPLLVRVLEYAREELKSDEDLHVFTTRLIKASKNTEVLTMDNYRELVPQKIEAATRLRATE